MLTLQLFISSDTTGSEGYATEEVRRDKREGSASYFAHFRICEE